MTFEGAILETGITLVAGGGATSELAGEGCGDAGCCTEEVSVLRVVAAAFPEGRRGLFSAASEWAAD